MLAMAGGGGRGDGVAADASLAGPSEPDAKLIPTRRDPFDLLSLLISLAIGESTFSGGGAARELMYGLENS